MSQAHSNLLQSLSLAAGAILQSRYRIVRQLGSGGMGTVYEAIDLRLGHTVAVKQTLTASQSLGKQFEREARLMAALNHPALPRVSDYFTEHNRAFLVMQHIDGNDLAETLAQQPGPLPKHLVIAWADQLLDALIYLHSHDRQIVHRDIKPHNLKITETGRIALLDFGLAKSQGVDSEDDETGRSIFGYSPRYAPLEQIQDLGTTPQSDIYALGATLYHLLTGVKPPDAVARAAAIVSSQNDPLVAAHNINPGLGEELSTVLDRAMAQNPEERYASASDFREALRRLGRLKPNQDVELVAHGAEAVASVAAVGDTHLIAAVRVRATSRLGIRAVAAVLLILLTAFGVFCRYYQWKVPAMSIDSGGVVTSISSLRPSDLNTHQELGRPLTRPAKSKERYRHRK
jgi:serine/threonine protein kinase